MHINKKIFSRNSFQVHKQAMVHLLINCCCKYIDRFNLDRINKIQKFTWNSWNSKIKVMKWWRVLIGDISVSISDDAWYT